MRFKLRLIKGNNDINWKYIIITLYKCNSCHTPKWCVDYIDHLLDEDLLLTFAASIKYCVNFL